MNRLSFPILVLFIFTGLGCSSEPANSGITRAPAFDTRESTRVIIEQPTFVGVPSKSTGSGDFQLTEKEKALLNQSIEQVGNVIRISKEITDTDSALMSLNQLREARNSLQKTREEFKSVLSESSRRFRIYATDEGKKLQTEMWKMKKELQRLENDQAIQVVLADGMDSSLPTESITAGEEREKFTVTASANTSSSQNSTKTADQKKSKSGSTLVVSEDSDP